MKKNISIFFTIFVLLTACAHLEQSFEPKVQNPKLKFEPKLIYPLEAQNTNRSGISTILITIDKDGIVKETSIFKSSGYIDLDETAENYCKGLVFYPATQNGDPIPAKMRWQVRFDLTDLSKNIISKIDQVNLLYESLGKEYSDRQKIQSDILSIHKDIIEKIRDGEKFNQYMYNVVQNGIVENWKNISGNFPLSFLLYHDFITRFGYYENIEIIKSQLKNAAESELNYLKSAKKINEEFGINKELLIKKIKEFLESNYLR